MPVDMSKYPDNWNEIRAQILRRAGGCEGDPRFGARCEDCGVYNYAVGYRDAQGRFWPNAGNGPCDASGMGQDWPSGYLSYSEAKEFADHNNEMDTDGHKWIVIVLTVAHINDPNPMNCEPSNLKALCQRCHNILDAPMRQLNRKINIGQLPLPVETT